MDSREPMASSPPFAYNIPETGEIWFTDMDAGFFVTRFAPGVWPFAP